MARRPPDQPIRIGLTVLPTRIDRWEEVSHSPGGSIQREITLAVDPLDRIVRVMDCDGTVLGQLATTTPKDQQIHDDILAYPQGWTAVNPCWSDKGWHGITVAKSWPTLF